MNLYTIKKLSSVVLVLSILGQNFLYLNNTVFADDYLNTDNSSQNRISRGILDKKQNLSNQIKSSNGFNNAKINFNEDAKITSIRNLNIKSSGDHRADLENILGVINNRVSLKSNSSDFQILSELTDKITSGKHTRLVETYKGIPVFGRQAIIHEDDNNIIKSLSTNLGQDINIDVTPKLSSDEAFLIGQNSLTSSTDFKNTKKPNLIIYPINDYSNVLTYNFEITSNNITNNKAERWIFFVDAMKGKIIQKYNGIADLTPTYNGVVTTVSGSMMTSEGGATVSFPGWKDNTSSGYFLLDDSLQYELYNISTNSGLYTDASSYIYRTSSNWGNSDPIEISAAKNINTTLTYFKSIFNYSASNITGSTGSNIPVVVHKTMDNAYRDGDMIVLGDGDGIEDGSLATLDVIGHEFSHAWTEYTSNLTYYSEPGAINESFSDIMGTNIEFYGQEDGTAAYPGKLAGKADWLIGEDIAYSGAFRDMRDPQRLDQPSRYLGTKWYFGTGDNAGVHYNSSVQNYFYYLLVNGGSGNNDGISYSLSGVGLSQAQDLAFRVNSYYIMPNDNYTLAALAWENAADDLDVSGNLLNSVKQAWEAVGIYTDVLDQYNSIIDYNFSSGSTIPTDFSNTGSVLWSTDSSTGAISSGSIISGLIGNSQSSVINWSGTTNSGYLGFRYKTSSEVSYDELKFYVDNVLYTSESGINPRSFYTKLVPSGTHNFKWEYSKDISFSGGLDRVWIDDITLPIGSSGSFSMSDSPSIINVNSNYYTSGSSIPLLISSNKNDSTMTFSGADFSSGSHIFTQGLTGSINLNMTSTGVGAKNISASLIDRLGNTKLLTGSVIFDNVGPLGPVFSSFTGGTIFHTGSITLNWNDAVDSLVGTSGNYYYELTNTYNSYTNSGNVTGTGLTKTGLGDGVYSFLVKGFDLLGNEGNTSTGNIIIDGGSPTASGIFLSGAYTNTSVNTLRLTSSEQITYNITSTGITSSLSGITSSGITFLPITLSGSDGVKVLNISFSDSAGNTGSVNSLITLDNVAPSYILNVYNDYLTQGTSFTLTGTVTDEYSGVGSVSINGTNLTGSLSNWTKSVNLTAGLNAFNFIFSDNLGNTTSTGVNLIRTSIVNNVGSFVNSTGSVIINFNTDISATGGIIYGTTPNGINNYIAGISNTTNHSINLSGLASNTLYYYKAFGKNLGFTGQLSSTYTFNTPQTLVDSTGSQVATGSVIISGATSTGVVFGSSSGTALILSNDGGSSILLNLGGLSINASGSSWDGILQGPEIYATGLVLNATGYSRVGNYYEIGNYNSSLSLTGNTVSISIFIGTSYNGQTLRVYRSEDRVNFNSLTTCLVSAGICQFNTDHFSLFAFGEPSDSIPDAFNFTPVTLAELSQEYSSNAVTLTGFNIASPITITGGAYKINNGSYTSSTGSVNSGDIVTIKVTSSSSYSTTVSSTLNVGGVSSTYTVSTKSTSSGGGGGGGGGSSYTAPVVTNTGVVNQVIQQPIVTSNAKKNIKKVKITLSDISDSFAKDDINSLVSKGIIKGFSDGTFRPNSNATRAEFLAITMKAFNIDLISKSKNSFTDIDSSVSWINPYVIKAKELGIISGQTINGKLVFRPNDSITRAESLVILFKIAKIDTKSTKKLEFTDEFSPWMISYVIKAKELGIISGQIKDGKLIFRPNDSITRAESSRIIMKTLGIK